MDYCIVDPDGIIENMIVCEGEDIATALGARPSYEGAMIGDVYVPPCAPISVVPAPTVEERLIALEEAQAAQDEALIELYEMMEG